LGWYEKLYGLNRWDEEEYFRISNYIKKNPLTWMADKFNNSKQ
jgi:hypothetical protein